MSSAIHKIGNCRKCHQIVALELVACRIASGAHHYTRWCPECDANAGHGFIKLELIKSHGINPDELRVIPGNVYARCVRCGHRGAELHHWYPQSLDQQEAEKWPKDYLCKNCHDEWHKAITPLLTGRKAS